MQFLGTEHRFILQADGRYIHEVYEVFRPAPVNGEPLRDATGWLVTTDKLVRSEIVDSDTAISEARRIHREDGANARYMRNPFGAHEWIAVGAWPLMAVS